MTNSTRYRKHGTSLGTAGRTFQAQGLLSKKETLLNPLFLRSVKNRKDAFKDTTLKKVQPCLVLRRIGQDGLEILCQHRHSLSLLVASEDLKTLYKCPISLSQPACVQFHHLLFGDEKTKPPNWEMTSFGEMAAASQHPCSSCKDPLGQQYSACPLVLFNFY